MTIDLEQRKTTIVEGVAPEVIQAILEAVLNNEPKTFKIFPCDDGKWGVSYNINEWKPSYSMSCVGKVSAVIGNVINRMGEYPEETVFLQVKEDMGNHVVVYHLEHR